MPEKEVRVLEFKQLEAFVYVVKMGSFSRAAEKLYLTQPTVSAHIRSLEKQLDATLLVRGSKEAYPTSMGAVLYEYALEMLTLRENAILACCENRGQISGQIQIAASSIPFKYALPKLMVDFRQTYPDVVFQVESSDSQAVVNSIVAGQVELGIVGTVLEQGKCVYHDFMEDNLVVITPDTPQFDSVPAEGFPLRALRQHPYIAREPGSGTRKEAEKVLQERGVNLSTLNIVAQLDNPDAIKHSVSQGLGISIVSRLSVADYEQFGKLRVFQLEGAPVLRKLYVVHHKNRVLSLASAAFIRFAVGDSAL